MKRSIRAILILIVAASAVGAMGADSGGSAPTQAEWAKMADGERFGRLEKLGHVPSYAKMPEDWHLAEKTSWWGKPIDPKEFWKGRVVWLDSAATADARSRGRSWPPMPYQDQTLPKFKDNSDLPPEESIEGFNIYFHQNSGEVAFWDKFIKTHPHPPDELENKQVDVAESAIPWHQQLERRPLPKFAVEVSVGPQHTALQMGFPPEAMTDQALFAAYVLAKSRDYQNILQGPSFMVSNLTRNFLGRLVVDPKYVTNAPTAEMIQAADAWKVPYLQRLQRENTDSSYINAYLKAWNIPASALSGAPK